MDELSLEQIAAAKKYVEQHADTHRLLLEHEGTSADDVMTLCQYAMAWWYREHSRGRA